jgi:DNA repair protein RecN (Recombination protein N)
MLVELAVANLGVIADAKIALGPGMTALTGETGAGKTMAVEALGLLLGARPDPDMVRTGADEATVEGWFVDEADGSEQILARTIPANGRARAWVDGRQVPTGRLAEIGARLVELHGQHAHQTLLDAAAQRRALDRFAGVDLQPLAAARRARQQAVAELERLGGTQAERARRADLLRFQIDEIEGAGIDGPDEDLRLAAEEERLADLTAHRLAAETALAALNGSDLTGDSGAEGALGQAVTALGGRPAFVDLARRVAGLHAEVTEVARELRVVLDTWEEDPVRLDELRRRRQLLHDLAKKYGGDLSAVLDGLDAARADLAALEAAQARADALAEEVEQRRQAESDAEALVGRRRREAAPALAGAVEARLRDLSLGAARLQVHVGGADLGDQVAFLLAANPGSAPLALSKVASGGELARTMLALRLVLSEGPPTMVFDEVDAGVGGEAALAVGRALAEVGARHQVVVVTHLAQVAAFADRQISVDKAVVDGVTRSQFQVVDGEDRLVELARMLSGQPASGTARRHAAELLDLVREGGRTAR